MAFPGETLRFLEQRYYAGMQWAWSATPLPSTLHLGRHRLARLTEMLVGDVRSRLVLERSLLGLLHEMSEPEHSTLPLWLHTALTHFENDADGLVGGVAALASLAGRSPEHVNRVLREQTGRTATETINDLRIDRAAFELRMTDRPIADIAAACGLANLSHFYRLFGARFGMTPRGYRVRNAALILGGVHSMKRRPAT